jgi:hypothetical protein
MIVTLNPNTVGVPVTQLNKTRVSVDVALAGPATLYVAVYDIDY